MPGQQLKKKKQPHRSSQSFWSRIRGKSGPVPKAISVHGGAFGSALIQYSNDGYQRKGYSLDGGLDKDLKSGGLRNTPSWQPALADWSYDSLTSEEDSSSRNCSHTDENTDQSSLQDTSHRTDPDVLSGTQNVSKRVSDKAATNSAEAPAAVLVDSVVHEKDEYGSRLEKLQGDIVRMQSTVEDLVEHKSGFERLRLEKIEMEKAYQKILDELMQQIKSLKEQNNALNNEGNGLDLQKELDESENLRKEDQKKFDKCLQHATEQIKLSLHLQQTLKAECLELTSQVSTLKQQNAALTALLLQQRQLHPIPFATKEIANNSEQLAEKLRMCDSDLQPDELKNFASEENVKSSAEDDCESQEDTWSFTVEGAEGAMAESGFSDEDYGVSVCCASEAARPEGGSAERAADSDLVAPRPSLTAHNVSYATPNLSTIYENSGFQNSPLAETARPNPNDADPQHSAGSSRVTPVVLNHSLEYTTGRGSVACKEGTKYPPTNDNESALFDKDVEIADSEMWRVPALHGGENPFTSSTPISDKHRQSKCSGATLASTEPPPDRSDSTDDRRAMGPPEGQGIDEIECGRGGGGGGCCSSTVVADLSLRTDCPGAEISDGVLNASVSELRITAEDCSDGGCSGRVSDPEEADYVEVGAIQLPSSEVMSTETRREEAQADNISLSDSCCDDDGAAVLSSCSDDGSSASESESRKRPDPE